MAVSSRLAHDMGKPAFLHATHCTETKVIYVIEGLGATDEDGENIHFMVPSEVLDTPELRSSNQRYLTTGIKVQEEVKLRTPGDMRQFGGNLTRLG